MKHRIALAREQCVNVDAAHRRQLIEAAPLQFVRDKDRALLGGQFIERGFQFFQQPVAQVESLRSGIGRWQQIFDPQQLAVFVRRPRRR